MSGFARITVACFIMLAIAVLVGSWKRRDGPGPSSALDRPPALSAKKPSRANFVNRRQDAGIRFVHNNGRKGLATALEEAGPGCAMCDYDGDGYLDLYIVNGRDLYGRGQRMRNALYHNNGNGTFTDVTESAHAPGTGYGLGCVWGDYDGDGHPDLYVTQWERNVLYRNNGDGTFSDATVHARVGAMEFGEPFHAGAVFCDYDRDGWLDLYVCGYLKFRLDGLRYCMLEGRVKTSCPPQAYDGTPDLLYHNNGDGTFTNVTRRAGVYNQGRGLVPVFSDYDHDGFSDLIVANDGMEAYLYRNQRNGTFRNIAVSAGIAYTSEGGNMAAMGTDLGDYDNDGRLDLFIADFQNAPNHLWHNEGKGFFVEVTAPSGVGEPSYNYLGFGAGFFDFDNDGWLDIFVANGHVYPGVDQLNNGEEYKQQNQLFENRKDRTFAEVTQRAGSGLQIKAASRGAAFGDYDNDGRDDILVANNEDPPTLLHNESPHCGHFVNIQLLDTRRCEAIECRVRVQSGGLSQIREVRTGGSFFSHNDTRVRFGLGTHDRIDKIEVEWLDGRRQTFEGTPADRFYRIVENDPRIRSVGSAKSKNQ
jgi:hypothetical protein